MLRYETALKASKFILVAHGSAPEVAKAKNILMPNKAEEANVHEVVIGRQAAPVSA